MDSSSCADSRGPGKAAITDTIQMCGAVPDLRFTEWAIQSPGTISGAAREHVHGGEAVLLCAGGSSLETGMSREETNRGKKMSQLVKVKRI